MLIPTAQTYDYTAFGLRIRSELLLPDLTVSRQPADAPDIHIRLASIAREMPDNSVEVDGDQVFIKVNQAALFCIDGGTAITVALAKDAPIERAKLYLLGSCMGALLLQRGILPLHGSAVEKDGKAYVIVGESGAGKSTLAAALLDQGCRLLSDDIAAISLDGDGNPCVAFAYPQQKLWKESLTYFGMDAACYRTVQPDEDKYLVPVPNSYRVGSVPLSGVYELAIAGHAGQPQVQQTQLLERLHLLLQHTYRFAFIRRLGLEQWHFSTIASIARQVYVNRIVRPGDQSTVRQLATAVLDHIRRHGG